MLVLFSYQSPMPVATGTPRHENRIAGWPVFSTGARD